MINLEDYNYIIKSSSGEKRIINGEEFTVLDQKEPYITEYEAARGYLRLKDKGKELKLLERIKNTSKWREISFEYLIKKIKENKTHKAKRALKGLEEIV